MSAVLLINFMRRSTFHLHITCSEMFVNFNSFSPHLSIFRDRFRPLLSLYLRNIMKDSPGYLVTHSLANSARFKHALFVDAAAASIRSVMDELMKKPESDHVFCYF